MPEARTRDTFSSFATMHLVSAAFAGEKAFPHKVLLRGRASNTETSAAPAA
jgi:hypothetical protein